jgi:hypothetical protein
MSLTKYSFFQIKHKKYLIYSTQIHLLYIVGQFCKADSTSAIAEPSSDKSYGLMNNTMLMENFPYFHCSQSHVSRILAYMYIHFAFLF